MMKNPDLVYVTICRSKAGRFESLEVLGASDDIKSAEHNAAIDRQERPEATIELVPYIPMSAASTGSENRREEPLWSHTVESREQPDLTVRIPSKTEARAAFQARRVDDDGSAAYQREFVLSRWAPGKKRAAMGGDLDELTARTRRNAEDWRARALAAEAWLWELVTIARDPRGGLGHAGVQDDLMRALCRLTEELNQRTKKA